MKKTQLIELLCLIKRTIVPFLSIVLFITMSITLYAGLTWTGRALQNRVDDALDQANAYDYAVVAKLGLTDDDINQIASMEGVDDIEPAYVSYETIKSGGSTSGTVANSSATTSGSAGSSEAAGAAGATGASAADGATGSAGADEASSTNAASATSTASMASATGENLYCSVNSIPERISTLTVVEGTLPDEPNELALLRNCTQFCNYKVGDTITFEADGSNPSVNEGMKYLTGKTFTITALVDSPDYLCKSFASLGITPAGKQITCVFYATDGAFSTEAFGNSYPTAYITGTGLRGLNAFGSDYKSASSGIYGSIEAIGVTLAQERYAGIKSDANEKIDSGQRQLDDAGTQISDAETQIAEGKQQLTDKITELDSAKDALNKAVTEMNIEKADAAEQFAQMESALADARDQLSQAQAQYDEAESQVEYYDNMSSSLKVLSEDRVNRFEALKTEATSHVTDPDFSTWLQNQCDELNTETAAQVAVFKETYPTRPSEIEPLLDGLQVSATDQATDEAAAQNAAGLGVAGDKIQTDVVQPGREELASSKAAIDEMSASIDDAQAQLDANRALYNEKMAQAESQINSGEGQIASGEETVADSEKQLADGETQLAEKKSEYSQGAAALDSAKADAQKITHSSWLVTDRDDSYVYQLVTTSALTLRRLRLTMALLFIVVGILVCYTVMSRLVHEHLVQLGTKKALGFTLFEIARQFLGYALLACALGILLGSLVGAPIVQIVLIPSMNQYVFDAPGAMFQFSDIVIVGLVQVALICLAAWLACRSILKKNAVELLGGHRPPAAKRRFYEGWACWRRMGLLAQTMVSNCFNDKRRVFATLVGVAGCTALIVCAVTLQGGIKNTTDEQETVIEKFDQVVYVTDSTSSTSSAGTTSTGVDASNASSSSAGAASTGSATSSTSAASASSTTASSTDGAANTVDGIISSKGYPSLRALYCARNIDLPDNSMTYVSLIVPESMDELSRVMTLQLVQGDSTTSASGVYISSALANYYHYGVGDELTFSSSDDIEYKVPIVGIFNYYGGTHVAIMSGAAYRDCFGEKPQYTARLVASGSEASEFSELVRNATDFDMLVNSRQIAQEISETVNRLALTVVAIYVGISALVALLVLLNLNIMYVSEKKRELIVMMVNGYRPKDAKGYVSRDTAILDVLGMVIGCALGTGMGILAIHSLQNNRLAFIANVNPFAWLVGIVICGLFAFVVMRIALRRVDKFALTSVND